MWCIDYDLNHLVSNKNTFYEYVNFKDTMKMSAVNNWVYLTTLEIILFVKLNIFVLIKDFKWLCYNVR